MDFEFNLALEIGYLKLMSKLKTNQKGFTLIEVIVGLAVFMVFAVGVYTSTQYIFKIVYSSRLKILEIQILNEQVEIIRNLPFESVGIVNGSPAGLLQRIATSTRNGINFTITRTIRNIDDPFDGTAGGSPNDTAPADYKLAEVEIVCSSCNQNTPLRLSTYVAPKNLEGNPNHGALFILVLNANGDPVQGATVHVVATSTNPILDLTDTTDNDGMLRLVDIATGTNAYGVTVSKNGYTSDQTNFATVANPNPIKQPATVVVKDVTKISLSIDLASAMVISTINNSCQPVVNVPINVYGTKKIGDDPDVLKLNQNITTNGSGIYNFNNLEWDAYTLRLSNYDLIGSIPASPINLNPGVNQPVQLILGSATANSLLVSVVDGITNQPMASTNVRVTASGYDTTKITGVGYINQTDWSGGMNQPIMIDPSKYWTGDGKINTTISVGNLKLKKNGTKYYSSGNLESSTFDLGITSNFVNLIWKPLGQSIPQVGVHSVRYQVATSNSSTPAIWNYIGYDGTSATYFDENNFSLIDIPAGRYFRYKIFLSTINTSYTPTVSDLAITYITSCTPPGQTYFGNLSAQNYTVTIFKDGYQTSTQAMAVSGDTLLGAKLIAS